MISILRDLPFFDKETTIAVPRGNALVRPYQIVVWVSVTPQHVIDLPASAQRFPAVLDTGNNHNFSIRHAHLLSWAGTAVTEHFERGRMIVADQEIPLVNANVWLHRNRLGERDLLGRKPPICLELPEGIAVYPPNALHAVRLPTLGLRGLVRNGLRLVVDGRRRRISLFRMT